MNSLFKYISLFIGIILLCIGSFTWGYGSYKQSQKVNIDDFVKTYVKFQNLKIIYAQYLQDNEDDKYISCEYNLKQYTLTNIYFKHGLYIYKITGERVKSSESVQFKKLVVLQYNQNIDITERLNKLNSLFDLYV